MRISLAGLAVALCLLLISAAALSGCGGNSITSENTTTSASSPAAETSNPTSTAASQSPSASSPTVPFITVPDSTSSSGTVPVTSVTNTPTQTTNIVPTKTTTQSTTTTPSVTTITINPIPPSSITPTTPTTTKTPPPIVATVTVDAPDRVAVGSDFTASIKVSPVTLFSGALYTISYNPEVLRLDDVTPGHINDTEITVKGYNKSNPGYCIVLQYLAGLVGVTGSGTLAVVHFHVLGGETSPITLLNGSMANTESETLGVDWVGDSVSVY
jgi:hypothetical protein